jgi:hypothetical protein
VFSLFRLSPPDYRFALFSRFDNFKIGLDEIGIHLRSLHKKLRTGEVAIKTSYYMVSVGCTKALPISLAPEA